CLSSYFFFTDLSTTETYTLSLHDALPIFKTKQKFFADDPIWTSPRPLPVNGVSARKLSEYYDFFNNTFFPSGERAPHKGVFLPSDRKSTRLNSSHVAISYAVFCLKKKKKK